MDPIKDSIALHRICPIQQHTKNCVAGGCMAWSTGISLPVYSEVPWPEEIQRPRAPTGIEAAMSLEPAPSNPAEVAAWIKAKSTEALRSLIGTKHEGLQVVDAKALDFKLTKVRLTLEGEATGHCSLIR